MASLLSHVACLQEETPPAKKDEKEQPEKEEEKKEEKKEEEKKEEANQKENEEPKPGERVDSVCARPFALLHTSFFLLLRNEDQ